MVFVGLLMVVVGFALAAALSLRTAARSSHSLVAAALATAAQVALYPRTYSYPKLLVQAIAVAVAWLVPAPTIVLTAPCPIIPAGPAGMPAAINSVC